jgi:alpha-methylacyl-CoA racemase
VFTTVAGVDQPAPAPRFARTPAASPTPPVPPGAHSAEVLAHFGFTAEETALLRDSGVVG